MLTITKLPNGLTVASETMPRVETVSIGALPLLDSE